MSSLTYFVIMPPAFFCCDNQAAKRPNTKVKNLVIFSFLEFLFIVIYCYLLLCISLDFSILAAVVIFAECTSVLNVHVSQGSESHRNSLEKIKITTHSVNPGIRTLTR